MKTQNTASDQDLHPLLLIQQFKTHQWVRNKINLFKSFDMYGGIRVNVSEYLVYVR